MAAPHNSSAVSQDTLITIKISVNDNLKKLKLPLRDLGISVLPDKLRHVLDIKPEQHVVLERYSDSAGGYIILDENSPHVFKTLIRAAKAKLKLRLKATVTPVHVSDKTIVKEEEAAPKMAESSITPRDSTAFDQRSIGSGIFEFKEARASQQTLINDEAPVPRPFHAGRSSIFNAPVAPASIPPFQPSLAFRPREPVAPVAAVVPHPHAWSVYCNECDKAMDNEHFHCSICDSGDYDLCQDCVNSGKLCPGEGHWLVKRFILNGKVVNSTTERLQPHKTKSGPTVMAPEPLVGKEMPGAFTDETKTLNEEPRMPSRTCNSCVVILSEREFVTCTTCEDYDLCIKCHTADKHGHHPAHGFKPATADTVLPLAAEIKLAPGRNVRHNAICDGCDKKIYGVRHKCLNCPDFDYCGDCVQDSRKSHPRHRFAPLYTPIPDQAPSLIRHSGIFCDGPLCKDRKDQVHIHGVRYKCTICDDTDFCASCEALPFNHHNRTHPLIKLKTPVRNVNVSTENEDIRGNVRVMGDRRSPAVPTTNRSILAETAPASHANAATQVHTVAEYTPTEVKHEETKPLPIAVKKYEVSAPTPVQMAAASSSSATSSALLNAHFLRDTIPDGMKVRPEQLFTQVWTLKNPGPLVWPSGCSVRYVGGDNMLNVDNSHPASVTAIAEATESNVVGREVLVGEEVAFKIVLKAPVREGKAISYWRLKAADGTPFGHRLWCDVEVKKVEPAPVVPAPQSVPNEQLAAMQRVRLHEMHVARQLEQQRKNLEHANLAAMQAPFAPIPAAAQCEQPPAYDSMHLSARLSVMREQQQRQRRAAVRAQRDALNDHLLAQAQGHVINREDMPNWSSQMYPYLGNRAGKDCNDKERREALKQRVAHIKANILKTREEREKSAEELNQLKAANAEKKSNEELEKVKKIVAEVTKQADEGEMTEADENLEGSQMVFPKLDKESPASSTYQSATSSSGKGKAAYVENEAGEVERSAVPAPSSEEDFVDLDDELEVLSAADEESDDDGFLTDEEYDILDASDQETVAGN